MKKAVAMALLSFTVGMAYAENIYMTPIFGVGNQSCGSWTQARHTGTEYVDKAWVAGFLTGASAVYLQRFNLSPLNETIANRDDQGLWAWLDNYCLAHPLDSIATASGTLENELVDRSSLSKGK
jgi:glycogen synthase